MEHSPDSSAEKKVTFFKLLLSQRFAIYFVAVLLRVIFGLLFIDHSDGAVFFATGKDILILHTNIYNESSEQEFFNYFPLAYLAILPGQAIYYLLDLDNLYLQRLFLKLPLIIGDIVLAILINKNYSKMLVEKSMRTENGRNPSDLFNLPDCTRASKAELFILFNPFIILTSSIKGQFDILPVILLYLGWYRFKDERYFESGVLIGTAILFKQYGVLFSFILGLNLLKTKYKQFVKFCMGHLAIVIPVLSIAALLNFQGLVDHAIKYHFQRPPSGYSINSIIYYSLTIFTRQTYSSLFSVILGNLVEVVFFTSMLFILLYFGYQLWRSENQQTDVLKTLLYAFAGFYLFNNVFWEQYFIIFVVIWVEYKCLTFVSITDTSVLWNYVSLPLILIFRITFMTPDDVKNVMGTYWFQSMWFFAIILHFVLMSIFLKQGRPMFARWYIKYLYAIVLILMPFHFLFMSNVEDAQGFFEG